MLRCVGAACSRGCTNLSHANFATLFDRRDRVRLIDDRADDTADDRVRLIVDDHVGVSPLT